MKKHQIWTDEEIQYLKELHKQGYTNAEKAERLTDKFNAYFSPNAVKKKIQRLRKKTDWRTKETIDYKEEVEILKDGSHRSKKLIHMNEKQKKDPNFLLKAHGYDPGEWELVTARNNIWNTYSKKDGIQVLYSSKVTTKPKTNKDFEKLIEVIESQEPFDVKVNKQPVSVPYMLEIAPVDTHFGISSYDYYIPNQERIINRIKAKHWEQIVIPIGNDLFHNDDFRGRTASGREIQKVDMDKAWEDANRFYFPIIDKACEKSNSVKIVYVPGNHDESMSWAYVKNLMTKYPDLDFDDQFKQHKAHVFHKVFIGLTHGDKNRKNTTKIYNSKFRMEIAESKIREIHMAHLHGEDASTKDDYGIMLRTLPTQNKEDEWHDQNGYVGKNKRFMVFEYSTDALEGIYYV